MYNHVQVEGGIQHFGCHDGLRSTHAQVVVLGLVSELWLIHLL